MNNNILKNIIFIPILSVILVNSNLIAEESEKDLTDILEQDLVELETIQNDEENTQQNKNPYFKALDKAILLQDDDKKEIRSIKAQEIGKDADLIFNIIESAKNNYNKITKDNRKTEKPNQYEMQSVFNKIILSNGKPLSSQQNKGYREALYLSLDWNEDLIEKFKKQLIFSSESAKLPILSNNVTIMGINIQIESQNTLRIVCCDPKTKNNLYNKKLTTQKLQDIQKKVNDIMEQRKAWQDLIDKNRMLFHNELFKQAQEIFNTIKDIKKEIQQILE